MRILKVQREFEWTNKKQYSSMRMMKGPIAMLCVHITLLNKLFFDTIRKLLMKAACVAMNLTHLTVAWSGYFGRCAQNRTSTIPTPTPYPIPNPNPATNPNPLNLTPSPTLTLTLILTLPKYDRLCRNVSNGVRWCPMVSDGF